MGEAKRRKELKVPPKKFKREKTASGKRRDFTQMIVGSGTAGFIAMLMGAEHKRKEAEKYARDHHLD